MSIYHNGKEYGTTKVINYSASPDYNRGVTVDNIQTGNYQATDNGFLMIQLQSQQSNPTKVSVVRSTAPITDTGTEIASIVLSQYQYSETLTAQVMARDYYKLVIEGAGNPQVLSCMFYPYASNIPMKLIEDISIGQVAGLEDELDGKQNAGDYATNTALNDGLATKQNKGNYFNKDTDVLSIDKGGTGADNADDARTNLQAMQFYIAKTGVNNDLNNITNTCVIRFNGNAVNGPGSTWGHALCYYHRDNNKYQIYIGWNGAQYMRVCQGSSSGSTNYRPWKKILNADGTIPSDNIPPTVLKYENSDGIWTETKLISGEVMLEGWGIGSTSQSSVTIPLPKSVQTIGSIAGISVYGLANAYTLMTNVMIMSSLRHMKSNSSFSISVPEGTTSFAGGYSWEFKGILAQ